LEIPEDRQLLILKNLGCEIVPGAHPGASRVTPPSARLDLNREIDLIEEVARVSGYEFIQPQAPKISSHLSPVGSSIPFETETRQLFHQWGLYEAVNTTFLPPDYADRLYLNQTDPLREGPILLNPLAEDQKVLRPSLLPSLLSNIQLNLSHQQPRVALYELNKVFKRLSGKPPAESFQAAAVMAGLIQEPTWTAPERPADFYDSKGLAESLISHAGFKGLKWEYGTLGMPYQRSESFKVINTTGQPLLWGGTLSPKVLKNYGINSRVAAMEADLTLLGQGSFAPLQYRPLPRFPEAWRDIALIVPDGVTSAQVSEGVQALKPVYLVSMALFDHYRGQGIPSGARSLAYRLRFRDADRTLTEAEINDSMSKILTYLKESFSIAIR
jgi:phenylalanyl-tRNA synthetase beta chain